TAGGQASGGAIYYDTGNDLGAISASLFSENLAVGGHASTGRGGNALGGAVFLDNDVFGDSIVDTSFVANLAEAGDSDSGAGGTAEGGAFNGPVVQVSTSIFDDNQALGGTSVGSTGSGGFAGGAALWEPDSEILNTRFRNNAAIGGSGERGGSARGGAISSSELDRIDDVTFEGNSVVGGEGTTGNGGFARGGAFYDDNGPKLRNVTFAGNSAVGGDSTAGASGRDARGGALLTTSNLTLSHATFIQNHATAGSGAGGDGMAAGAVYSEGDLEITASIFQGNTATTPASGTVASDCFDDGGLMSLGYNVVEAPGNCVLVSTNDQTGVSSSVLPLGDHGCVTALPDGSCVETHPLDLSSVAIDAASCALSGVTLDQRTFGRPVDILTVANADDGCDAGAYESRDHDIDEVEDGVDNCPDDANTDQSDADADGAGDACDLCFGDNTTGDTDADGVCDDEDQCAGADDGEDADADGVPDGCDLCTGDDSTGDSDGDGVCADRDCNDNDAGNACLVFMDGFEAGDTAAWSSTIP
ncbi:MAG: choice-of-anchor Q domain-containing protein, partial [Acidobacteriota bacterium]